MTIIKIEEYTKSKKPNGKIYKKITLKCDECNIEYECRKDYLHRAIKSELHFCTRKCTNISFKNGLLKSKSVNSILEKYGSSYVETDAFKDKVKNICLEKYGVPSALEAKEVLEKIKKTCVEKYGRETFAGSEEHQSKLDYKEISRKGWITKIKKGNCSKSLPEEKMNSILCEEFGTENVERQVFIIRQWVDFYIKSIDVYIQVDGEYWHGLNRPIEVISEQKTSQDVKIYRQIQRDEKLNKYMLDNNMRIIRITDVQLKELSAQDILNIIKG